MSKIEDWKRSNPKKKPIPTPECFGTPERCRECNECWIHNECCDAKRENDRLSREIIESGRG